MTTRTPRHLPERRHPRCRTTSSVAPTPSRRRCNETDHDDVTRCWWKRLSPGGRDSRTARGVGLRAPLRHPVQYAEGGWNLFLASEDLRRALKSGPGGNQDADADVRRVPIAQGCGRHRAELRTD